MIDVSKYIDLINAEVVDNASCINQGIPHDYAAYKHKVGYGEGLSKAKEILESLMEDDGSGRE